MRGGRRGKPDFSAWLECLRQSLEGVVIPTVAGRVWYDGPVIRGAARAAEMMMRPSIQQFTAVVQEPAEPPTHIAGDVWMFQRPIDRMVLWVLCNVRTGQVLGWTARDHRAVYGVWPEELARAGREYVLTGRTSIQAPDW